MITSELQLLLNLLGEVHWYGDCRGGLGELNLGELQPRPLRFSETGDSCGVLSNTIKLPSLLSVALLFACFDGDSAFTDVLSKVNEVFLDRINGDLYLELIVTKCDWQTDSSEQLVSYSNAMAGAHK